MMCDIILAAENAKFGQPEIKLGIIPGAGGTQRLSRLVGPSRAKDIIFTGRFVKADEALSIGLVDRVLPDRLDFINSLYWPVVLAICICFLATLYHVSVPVRTNWSFNLPGAAFALFCWIAGSYVLRWVLTVTAAESRSIYGPLAAPIAVLLWLYLLALAVLIGAAVNAAFDTVFPQKNTTRARLELVQRLRERISVRDS